MAGFNVEYVAGLEDNGGCPLECQTVEARKRNGNGNTRICSEGRSRAAERQRCTSCGREGIARSVNRNILGSDESVDGDLAGTRGAKNRIVSISPDIPRRSPVGAGEIPKEIAGPAIDGPGIRCRVSGEAHSEKGQDRDAEWTFHDVNQGLFAGGEIWEGVPQITAPD